MPLPQYMTVASLFVQAGAALIIAWVFVGLQRRYWRPFLRHWTRSWLALAAYTALSALARIVLVGRTIEFVLHAAISVMSGIAGCLQLAWLLLGTFELTTGKTSRRRRCDASSSGPLCSAHCCRRCSGGTRRTARWSTSFA